MPHTLLPLARSIRQQILYDWKAFFAETLKTAGPVDGAFLIQNEDAWRKEMQSSVMQGAKEIVEDVRLIVSPWQLTPADTLHLPIVVINGLHDPIIPPRLAPIFKDFVRNALFLPPFADMGHFPSLGHYGRAFGELGKLLDSQGKRSSLSRGIRRQLS